MIAMPMGPRAHDDYSKGNQAAESFNLQWLARYSILFIG
jgi:hypothetical protein